MLFFRLFRFNLLALSVSCVLIWGEITHAQVVDPNIQSQVDTFSPAPRPSDTIVRGETVTVVEPVYQNFTDRKRILPPNAPQLLQDAMKAAGRSPPATILEMDTKSLEPLYETFNIGEVKVTRRRERVGTTEKTVEKPRATEITVRVNGAYSYETNASKSNAARASDHIASGGANFSIKSPIMGTLEDTMAIYGGTTSVRYHQLTSKDFDSPSIGAAYTHLLWRTENPKSNGTITRQLVSLAVEGVSVMQPTYKSPNVNYTTQTLALTRDNMPLSGDLCGAKGKESYCHAATVSFAVRHTAADVKTVDNTAVRLETALGWITTVPGLKVTTIGGVQAAYYDHVAAGRRDWVADITAKADWKLSDNATLTGLVKYTYQRSSISILDWDGFAQQLRLTWTF
jgi:hypothetical protein